MNLISGDSITKSTGDKTLFRGISFGLNEGDKAALVGRNGSGKSTLLKIICGLEEADSGSVFLNNDLKMKFVEQSPSFDGELTIEETAALLVKNDTSDRDEQKRKIISILQELQISDLSQKVKHLSGGNLKKIAIADAFSRDTNLLILDEPTNHLDLKTITWMENKLSRRTQAVLLVTHDRYFLENVVNAIYELDNETLYRYPGNYSRFLEQKSERQENMLQAEQKAKKFLKNEMEWLRRQPKARGTKQKARTDRIEEIASRKKISNPGSVEFSVSGRRLGKRILEIKNISKSFSERTLFKSFSHTFRGNERIGIIGPNGSGKSTLLNIIAGKIPTDTGDITVGQNTLIGYFDQTGASMNFEKKTLDFIKEEAGQKITMPDGSVITASRMLELFQFNSRMQNMQIQKLSGGEKRRLNLVLVLMKNPNFLILDEPTNDLDLATLAVLEDFIENFPGCVILVSHDRYFMDRTVDYLFALSENGVIEGYPGNYSDYIEYIESHEKEETVKKETAPKRQKEKTKLSFKEKKELEDLEKEIESLESENKKILEILQTGNDSHEKITEAGIRHQEIEVLLEEKIKRWEVLSSFES